MRKETEWRKKSLWRHYTFKYLFLILKTTETIRSIKHEDLDTKKSIEN